MIDDSKNKPSYECAEYQKQRRELEIVSDLAAGTLNLRELGTKYLPPEQAEDIIDYKIRLRGAVLFNAFERALHGLVGMVFRKEPTLGEDVPERLGGSEKEVTEGTAINIDGLLENVDLAGTHWTVWVKELFADAMRDGHSFIYVDMPPPLPEGATLADERAAKRRPYWVKYTKDQAINWRIDTKGNLEQITFKETSLESDGEFGEKEVNRYRVLRRGEWVLYEELRDKNESIVVEIARGTTSLIEIPVAIVYTRKTAPLISKPPLIDLALINIAHFQKYSDYSIYLHICSRPILWIRGGDPNKQIQAIGPYSLFHVAENGEVAFAETSGHALGAARQDLIDLQEQMAMLGLSMLAKKTPNRTATEEILDSVKSDSDLATAARSLKDGIELALQFMAQYLGLPSGGSVSLGATMEELILSPEELRAYTEMVNAEILSKPTIRALLKEANKLPEDYDEAEEQRRLEVAAQVVADAKALQPWNE